MRLVRTVRLNVTSMRFITLTAAVIFGAAIATLAGQSSGISFEVTADQTADVVSLTIRASHFLDTFDKVDGSFDRVKSGSPVVIEITHTNVSKQDAVYTWMSRMDNYTILVSRDDRKVVGETEKLRDFKDAIAGKSNKVIRSSIRQTVLKAGEQRHLHLVLTDYYDLSEPGRYRIQILEGLLQSNRITVEVAKS
jgi:hypothetical protein